ncbi:MAG: RdgB/HAM1 family non-canonical purine NTP pyrophosphatase [Dehalococcoidales bacterium]|nr:RdgB/HAM1 family non-canonical purine NTP pyrophosphatase [Dehalococcoidales bacterium]MDP7285827.1 RdgB/HAM1 family non-canonical purine NTP pyrophosphatase [Dehalococcoidales bacterium]MDP7415579.1 RdgB/HAM1 family non-canonical purine NTP pyrophosphatase [Dehalococcoidales bacterium]
MQDKLLLGTNNQAKMREFNSLLADLPIGLTTLAEQGIRVVVNEVGQSLEENARIKATLLAIESQLITLADDSGLEVDALGGEPGRLSARFAGENASDRERIDYLLARLKEVPWEKRTARFRCALALATPDRKVTFCSGECPGQITFTPMGDYGFGYDPVFYLPGLEKTMAELPLTLKNQVSHRGQAARQVYRALERLRKPQTY